MKSARWEIVPLGTLADFRNGINYTKNNFGVGVKVINVKDFQDYSIARYDELDEINPKGVIRADSLLQNDDILFVRSNGNRRLIGRSLYIAKLGEQITHSAFTIRARFHSSAALPRFYAYLFRSSLIRNALSSYGSGTNISNLNQRILESLQVSLPPFQVQRKIAAILSTYDDLIENNIRRIKILEEMARLIYREWFVNFRFPGHEKVKMVNSRLDGVPEGWEVKPIGQVIETLGGGTPSTKKEDYWDNGDVIWFSPSDLTANRAMFITDSSKKISQLGLQRSSAHLFSPYCVMMTSRATIGVIAINTKEACTNQGFIVCIPNEQLSTYQIYFWIEQNLETIDNIASGATYKEIGRGEFRELLIALPDSKTRERFGDIVYPIGKQIESLLSKNANLRRTRDLLLPKLISGEVDVEDLDINTSGLPV